MSNVALMDNFRTNANAAIKASGRSQRAIAEEIGIHFTTLNRILRGDVSPSIETCEKIAQAVGVRADTIFLEPVEKAG